MEEILKQRAINFYILGVIAIQKGMYAESISNFFKALFAICDLELYKKTKIIPKNHNERFESLRQFYPNFFTLLDSLFSTYRQTYTQILSKSRAEHVRSKIDEAFRAAGVDIPTA